MSELVGLELLHSTLNLENKCDALVAAVHWTLVLNGLLCVGLDTESEAETLSGERVRPSEQLPAGWNNKTADVYALKYVRRNKPDDHYAFIVKMVFADGILIVSILRKEDSAAVSFSVPVNNCIGENISNYASAFRNLDELWTQVENEVVKPLGLKSVTSLGTTQKQRTIPQEDHSNRDDIGFDPMTGPYHRPVPLGSSFPDDDSRLPPVGRGDLDPLGRARGGMLVDPRQFPRPPLQPLGTGSLPRSSVPPGARFDPFGPPIPDLDRRQHPRFSGPNPDHLPPPGYDDMFG